VWRPARQASNEGNMTVVIIIIVIGYLVLHLAAGHARYAHHRRRGRRGVNLYWSSVRRGLWVSIPLPGGFRLGRHL
jgi:H+/Cl- antiporter ClcA